MTFRLLSNTNSFKKACRQGLSSHLLAQPICCIILSKLATSIFVFFLFFFFLKYLFLIFFDKLRCCHGLLLCWHQVLLLNKVDLFRYKILYTDRQLKQFFPTYDGELSFMSVWILSSSRRWKKLKDWWKFLLGACVLCKACAVKNWTTFEGVYFNKGLKQMENKLIYTNCVAISNRWAIYKTVKTPLLVVCLTLVFRPRNAFRNSPTSMSWGCVCCQCMLPAYTACFRLPKKMLNWTQLGDI